VEVREEIKVKTEARKKKGISIKREEKVKEGRS